MRILLTGAASGIGSETALIASSRGHEVIAVDIEDAEFDDESIEFYQADIRDEERVQEIVDREDFDVLVNCAGYYEQGSIEDMPLEKLREIFDVNVFGTLNVTKKALPTLRENKGRVINVSSVAGKIAVPFSGQYCASKHAVEALSDALRMELEEVDVVVVEPGVIETGFNQRAREALENYIPDSLYSDEYEKILEEGGLDGVDPEVPAKKIVDAIEKKNPKARYQTPLRAKLFVALERFSPTWLKDYVKKKL